jgi:selenocysteine-specific elongation factor
LVREGLRHRRSGHQAPLADADRALLARVVAQLQPAGLRPPIVGELAAALGLPLPALVDDLGRLAQLGLLVRVAPNRYYLPQTVAELAGHARALADESADGHYDAAGYRDRTGIGRNLTVQVLEFLDRAGLSRFDGVRHWPLA